MPWSDFISDVISAWQESIRRFYSEIFFFLRPKHQTLNQNKQLCKVLVIPCNHGTQLIIKKAKATVSKQIYSKVVLRCKHIILGWCFTTSHRWLVFCLDFLPIYISRHGVSCHFSTPWSFTVPNLILTPFLLFLLLLFSYFPILRPSLNSLSFPLYLSFHFVDGSVSFCQLQTF